MTDGLFIKKVKELIAEHKQIPVEDVYIVWYCKTLQSWMAMASSNVSDGTYYEVTLNGDKNEIYFDEYLHNKNICVNLLTNEQEVTDMTIKWNESEKS